MTGVVLGSFRTMTSLLDVVSVYNVRSYQNDGRQMGSVDIKKSSLLDRENTVLVINISSFAYSSCNLYLVDPI